MMTVNRMTWLVILVLFLAAGWLIMSGKADGWKPVSAGRLGVMRLGADTPPNDKCCKAPNLQPCFTPCSGGDPALLNCGDISRDIATLMGATPTSMQHARTKLAPIAIRQTANCS